jgi:hypothetical protein
LNKILIDEGYVYQNRSNDTDALANDELVQQIAAEMRQIA